jgi:hypothetical protein
VAFGFARLPGGSRRYVNVSNVDSDVPIGETISRRHYDNIIERLGRRSHQPGVEAIRESERALERLREALAARAADLRGSAEAEASAAFLAARESEFERVSARHAAQSAGQRRFNAALETYVAEQRRQGKRISKVEARKSAEFKLIMADLKGRANPLGSAAIADENRFRRQKALDRLGGSQPFREEYRRMYGHLAKPGRGRQSLHQGRRVGGFRVKRRVSGG